jgi:hypothetical protein
MEKRSCDTCENEGTRWCGSCDVRWNGLERYDNYQKRTTPKYEPEPIIRVLQEAYKI